MNNADRSNPDNSAFPIPDSDGDCWEYNRGLSKREYMAAMAMQGLLIRRGVGECTDTFKAIADESWAMADIMLEDE